jgi:mannose-6-phosphate isomerase-like protein (cupin superfamily)
MSHPAHKSGAASPSKESPRIVRGAEGLTQDECEAKLHREGYDSYKWYDVPGAAYPSHHHSQDECVWVLKGEIHFEILGQKFELRAGDRLYLPAGSPHTVRVPRTAGVTYLIGRRNA